MLKQTPATDVKRVPVTCAVTPSKANQSGRSITRLHQQERLLLKQQHTASEIAASLVDADTPSKVAVGHDFRYICRLLVYCDGTMRTSVHVVGVFVIFD